MFGVALATNAYGANRAFLLRDLVSHLTYTQMFAYDTYYATNLGGALWTLALEMQLYLLFPLLARAFRRRPALTFVADGRACAGVEKVYCGGVLRREPVL